MNRQARHALCLAAAADMRAFAAECPFMSSAYISAIKTARMYLAKARAIRA